ncbi:hypothetical protein AB6A40_010344 [Gnathostoma spinigerum]|uniref:Transformation/transcription domain-associated protein n=1 Tax=Gnathostoma spinigerum TaxID=75299 RepID=A0ABD6EVW3_9BILA
MPQHIINGRMFEQRAQIRHCGTVNPMEDSVIESSLQYCYMPTLVFLTEADGSQKDGGYLLIPRASQSVKVLSEVPMFIIFLFQIHRHHLQSEMMEFIPLIVQYVNLLIPHEQRSSNSFSNALADDFYNSQVRALTFLGIIARQSMYNMADVMNSHSSSLVQGMLQLMENIPADNLGMRRELIITVKSFFSCEMRTKFIPILPRLFNESLLMGSGFTVNDQMRTSVYSMLADLVHHLRCHLSYVMLCCSVYVFSKSIHDQSLPSYVQSMCCKLIMNLIESFIANEKNHPDQPCRDLLFCILENYVRKFKVIAEFHVPLLLERNPVILAAGRVKVDDKPSSETNEKSNDGSKGDPDGGKASDKDMESIESFVKQETSHIPGATASEGPGNRTTIDVHQMLPASILCKGQTPNQILSQYWVQPSPPMSVTDAKSMVRVLVQACKHIVHGLKDTHMTTISCSPLRELQIMENLLKYGLRCLDVFMITSLPNQQVNSTVPRINGARSKDEKESLDLFASIFTLLNPSVFTELFSKYIDFFIERIAYNYTLQAICNAFLVNPSTSAKFGNILVRYLMKKLPEIAGQSYICLSESYREELISTCLFS